MAKTVARKPAPKRKTAAPRKEKAPRTEPPKIPVRPTEEDHLIPAAEARLLLGLWDPDERKACRKERNLIEHGTLKPIKIGNRNFYLRSYIDSIMKNGSPGPRWK